MKGDTDPVEGLGLYPMSDGKSLRILSRGDLVRCARGKVPTGYDGNEKTS